jgi:hypothetical protein
MSNGTLHFKAGTTQRRNPHAIHSILAISLFCFLTADRAQGRQADEKAASTPTTMETVETNISGIRVFLPPPSTFNALEASTFDLARYGLPPKPDRSKSPQAYRVWEDLVQASHERIVPGLQQSDIYHGPVKNLAPGKKLSTNSIASTSSNWSGFVIADTNNVFYQIGVVAAYYAVPSSATCSTGGPRLWSSNWIGVDGSGSPDVFQTGTSSDSDCTQGAHDHSLYYAWIEWFPNASILVNRGFPISAGDSMFIATFVDPGTGRYVLTLRNFTRRASLSVPMSPPAGTHLVGNSIEWVIERPQVNGALTNLASYNRNAWQTMMGYYQQGALIYRPSLAPTGTSYTLTMIDGQGINISVPTLYPGPVDDAAWFVGIPTL